MAFVLLVKNPTRLKLVYTVEKAVGPGCPNIRDDVLLVQLLLRGIMDDVPGRPNSGFKPPGEKPIQIDGRFGPQTKAYLKFYEAEENRRNADNPVVADGKIDPITPGQQFGSISGRGYKILTLNNQYQARKPTIHENIARDPLFPPELFNSLYVG